MNTGNVVVSPPFSYQVYQRYGLPFATQKRNFTRSVLVVGVAPFFTPASHGRSAFVMRGKAVDLVMRARETERHHELECATCSIISVLTQWGATLVIQLRERERACSIISRLTQWGATLVIQLRERRESVRVVSCV